MNSPITHRFFYPAVFTFILLSVLGQISTSIYTPFFQDLATRFATDINYIEQSIAIFLIAFSFSQLLAGIICDYVNKRRLLIAGLVLFLLGTGCIIVAHSESAFLLGRVIQGLGGGVGVSVTRALSRQLFNESQLNISLSLTNIAFGIAPAVSPILGTLIASSFEVAAIFYAVLILAVLTLLALISLPLARPPTHPATSQNVFQDTIELITTYFKRLFLVGLASGLLYGIVFCFVTIAPTIIIEQHNQDKTTFSLLSLFATLCFVLGSVANIKLSTISPLIKFKVASGLLCLISLISLGIITLFGATNLYLLLSVSYLIFLFIGIAMPCSVSIMLGYSNTSAGFLAALVGFFHLTGASIGAYLVALLNINPTLAFVLITSGLSVCSVIASARLSAQTNPLNT